MEGLDEKNSYVALLVYMALMWHPHVALRGAWKTTFSCHVIDVRGKTRHVSTNVGMLLAHQL